jgi:uncharacterized membrane protein YfcA
MEWYLIPAAIAAGFLAGFINTLAGSGSLVTLPMLIFLGLPATVANGTNRVGVLLQNLVAIDSFRRKGVFDLRGAVYLGAPAVLGSIVGAQIAVNLDEVAMRRAIGLLMVAMLFVIILRPQRWLQGVLDRLEGRPKLWQLALFFLIGIYGGFIQAGVGIFLLAGLVLGVGYNLVRANAVKVGVIFFFTISALVVFVRNDQVDWLLGFIIAIGNMLGAYIAAKLAVERGAVMVHRLLIVIVIVSALNLLGVFSWIGSLFT